MIIFSKNIYLCAVNCLHKYLVVAGDVPGVSAEPCIHLQKHSQTTYKNIPLTKVISHNLTVRS